MIWKVMEFGLAAAFLVLIGKEVLDGKETVYPQERDSAVVRERGTLRPGEDRVRADSLFLWRTQEAARREVGRMLRWREVDGGVGQ